MGDPKRAAALNRSRVARHRTKLRTPVEIEEEKMMEANSSDALRRNGFAVTDGLVQPCRGGKPSPMAHGTPRFKHTHLGIVRIDVTESKNAQALIAAVVSVVDEPACLVGTGKAGAVLIFRIGDNYEFEPRDASTQHRASQEFVLDDKPGMFTATADAQPLDVSAYVWLNDRSPLNTPIYALPPIHADIVQAPFDALKTFNGARLGPLVLPESPMERLLREHAERKASGVVDETPEQKDERLVAAHPASKPSDGVHGLAVAQARARIAARKEAEREAKAQKQAERDKAKLKALLGT